MSEWTAKELHFIEAARGKLPPRRVAAHLGRSVASIKGASNRLRIRRAAEGRPLPRLRAQVYRTIECHGRRIKEMNLGGHSDYAIAGALGINRRLVLAARRRLGLPACNANPCPRRGRP